MNMMQIGMSGLRASQSWLNVTSSNIAHVSTPGFSRRTLDVGALADGGVSVNGMRRITDQFVVAQVWGAASGVGFASNFASRMATLEKLISTDGGNLGMGFDRYFESLNGAMEDPGNTAYREDILNATKQLASQFNTLDQNLSKQIQQNNNGLDSSLLKVNGLTTEIATLNKQIADGINNGRDVNSLLDSRDQAITSLAEQLDVKVLTNSDGTIQVTLPKGQPLVLGEQAAKLEFAAGTNPADGKISLSFGPEKYQLSPDVGGAIGGLYKYHQEQLVSAQLVVDELAMRMADAFNNTQAAGFDLNGNPGKPMFEYDPADPAGTLKLAAAFTQTDLAFAGAPGSVGDNSNLKNMLNIKEMDFSFDSLGGQRFNLNGAFSALFSKVASEAAWANQEQKLATNISSAANNEWMSLSGVSLDEEALNLIQYQQNYAANAKVIATTDVLFNSIVSLL
ncbi:MAG: flagellar hook-associated protein FlgK [Plesiomonas sp.]